jgi:hypothetical protein
MAMMMNNGGGYVGGCVVVMGMGASSLAVCASFFALTSAVGIF